MALIAPEVRLVAVDGRWNALRFLARLTAGEEEESPPEGEKACPREEEGTPPFLLPIGIELSRLEIRNLAFSLDRGERFALSGVTLTASGEISSRRRALRVRLRSDGEPNDLEVVLPGRLRAGGALFLDLRGETNLERVSITGRLGLTKTHLTLGEEKGEFPPLAIALSAAGEPASGRWRVSTFRADLAELGHLAGRGEVTQGEGIGFAFEEGEMELDLARLREVTAPFLPWPLELEGRLSMRGMAVKGNRDAAGTKATLRGDLRFAGISGTFPPLPPDRPYGVSIGRLDGGVNLTALRLSILPGVSPRFSAIEGDLDLDLRDLHFESADAGGSVEDVGMDLHLSPEGEEGIALRGETTLRGGRLLLADGRRAETDATIGIDAMLDPVAGRLRLGGVRFRLGEVLEGRVRGRIDALAERADLSLGVKLHPSTLRRDFAGLLPPLPPTLSGTLTGEGKIAGRLDDLHFQGQIALSDGALSLPATGSFSGLSGTLSLETRLRRGGKAPYRIRDTTGALVLALRHFRIEGGTSQGGETQTIGGEDMRWTLGIHLPGEIEKGGTFETRIDTSRLHLPVEGDPDALPFSLAAHGTMARERLRIESLSIALADLFALDAQGTLSLPQRTFALAGRVSGIDLGGHAGRFLPLSPPPEVLSGGVSVIFSAEGDLPEGGVPLERWPLRLSVSATIEDFGFAWKGKRASEGTVHLTLSGSPGNLDTSARLSLAHLDIAGLMPISGLSLTGGARIEKLSSVHLGGVALETVEPRAKLDFGRGLTHHFAPPPASPWGGIELTEDVPLEVTIEFPPTSIGETRFSGKVTLAQTLSAVTGERFRIAGRLGVRGLMMEKSGVRLSDLAIDLPFREEIEVGSEGVTLPTSKRDSAPVLEFVYPYLQPFLREKGRLSLREIRIETAAFPRPLSVQDLSCALRLDGRRLSVRDLSLSLLDGTVIGDLSLDLAPSAPRLEIELETTGLDLADFLPEGGMRGEETRINGVLHLRFAGGEGLPADPEHFVAWLEEGEIAITRIGKRALDRLLFALDPDALNPSIVGLRRNLKLGGIRPSLVRISIRHGQLTISVRLKAAQFQGYVLHVLSGFGLLREHTIPRIPVSRLVKIYGKR
ncbi:MAG: hypothetical protein D6795_10255 [Deltaproteobacteria bacterium]|nr:MAG: hypothetical protein D6795_10255 [Deltaproteobacteria bacterium]